MKKKADRIATGNAAVYFVAGELSRRKFDATVTTGNTKAVDILAINSKGNQFAIQVKARRTTKTNKFLLDKKAEQKSKGKLFYIFVDLNGAKEPEYYIYSSKHVARDISKRQRAWLNLFPFL